MTIWHTWAAAMLFLVMARYAALDGHGRPNAAQHMDVR